MSIFRVGNSLRPNRRVALDSKPPTFTEGLLLFLSYTTGLVLLVLLLWTLLTFGGY